MHGLQDGSEDASKDESKDGSEATLMPTIGWITAAQRL
jgi:hypothetical protein